MVTGNGVDSPGEMLGAQACLGPGGERAPRLRPTRRLREAGCRTPRREPRRAGAGGTSRSLQSRFQDPPLLFRLLQPHSQRQWAPPA